MECNFSSRKRTSCLDYVRNIKSGDNVRLDGPRNTTRRSISHFRFLESISNLDGKVGVMLVMDEIKLGDVEKCV